MVEFTKGSMSPISDGTGIFIAAVAMVIIWSWALARGHYVPKDCFL